MGEAVVKTKLSVWEATATVIGCIIGASIFVLLGPITAKTGPSLWLAYFIAAIPAALSTITYAQLGSALPRTAGSYVYAKRLISPYAGFFNAWTLTSAAITSLGMMALGFADYLKFYFPSLPVSLTAVVIILFFYAANVLGLRMAGVIQLLMVIWMVLALALFAVPGLFNLRPGLPGPFLAGGVGGLLFAAALAFYSYSGYGVVAELGEEMDNPRRTLPLATMGAFVVVLIVYVSVTFVTTGVMPWAEVAKSQASVPDAASRFLPGWAITFIGLGALFAVATTINAILMALPREAMILGQEGLLPLWLGRRWSRTEAPVAALTVIAVLGIVSVLVGVSSAYLATIAVVGLLIGGVLAGIGGARLPSRLPSEYQNAVFRVAPGWLAFFGWASVVLCGLLALLALADTLSVGIILVIWHVLGGIWYYLKTRQPTQVGAVKAS